MCETWVASLQETNYKDARKFVPERWLYGETKSSPFLAVPFGVGRRMCPGKRIAEQEIMILTAKVTSHSTWVTNTRLVLHPKGLLKGSSQNFAPT